MCCKGACVQAHWVASWEDLQSPRNPTTKSLEKTAKTSEAKEEKGSPVSALGTRSILLALTLAFSLGSLVVPYGVLCSSLETTQRNSAWSSLP